MPEHLTELEEQTPSRGRSTGPRTPEGKANSSQNRLIHGLRSEKTVLRTESQQEFDANMQLWLNRYPTEDELIRLLVIQTAKAYWFLLRAQKRLEDVEFQLPENAYHWTDTYQQLLANFLRYKTTAERSFLRFLKELEARVPEPATPQPSLPTDHAPPVSPHSPLPTEHLSLVTDHSSLFSHHRSFPITVRRPPAVSDAEH